MRTCLLKDYLQVKTKETLLALTPLIRNLRQAGTTNLLLSASKHKLSLRVEVLDPTWPLSSEDSQFHSVLLLSHLSSLM